jgi:hypothetical protein
MTKTSKIVLIAAIVAGIASPVFAQSRDSGRNAFAMVPHGDAPAATGGGSIGYNADLAKKTD